MLVLRLKHHLENLGNDHMGPTKREVGVSSSTQKYVAGRFGVDDFPFQVGDFLDSMFIFQGVAHCGFIGCL